MSTFTQSQIQSMLGSVTEINREKMPACLLQTQGHPRMSGEYSPIPTIGVIEQMVNAGYAWNLVSKERSKACAGYETHLVAFDHPSFEFSDPELRQEGRPRLYFLNSFHGRRKASFFYGIFRFVCMNGLVSGFALKALTLKHIGLSADDIQSMVESMKSSCDIDATSLIRGMRDTEMTFDQQMDFAKKVMDLRLAGVDGVVGSEYEKLLIPNRDEDVGADVWRVLNRVQENVGLNFRRSPVSIKYTAERTDKEGNLVRKERKISKLSNIEQVMKLNEGVLSLASSYVPGSNSGLIAAAA
jgi:hypothetical protein